MLKNQEHFCGKIMRQQLAYYSGLVRAKFETLDFTGGCFGQVLRKLKPARIFVRRESCFTVLQQFSGRFFRSFR
jgi:hypothetical protein